MFLNDYIIATLHGDNSGPLPSHSDVQIRRNKVHWHTRIRVNYTSYDLRRQQDVINPKNRPDFMVLAGEPPDRVEPSMTEPYWFARAIKVGHVMAKLGNAETYERVDFVWARWLWTSNHSCSGWSYKRLPQVSFIPGGGDSSFAFIDPQDIVRAVHLIPVFGKGLTAHLLAGESIALAHQDAEEWEEWESFHVNM